jgi:hypothetical protein
MSGKLVLDPAAGRGVVRLDNRGEELLEQLYAAIAELFGGLGRVTTSAPAHRRCG